MYLMTISQSGPFAIQNLQGVWNNIAIGAYQAISGSTNVAYSGIIPSGATPGQVVTVTFKIFNISGQLVDTSTATVGVQGQSNGWQKVWTAQSQGGPPGYNNHYIGDFDGDGDEDILGVSASGWITMFSYGNNDWQWAWSNNGDASVGGGIYSYRDKLLVGDFDGDGKDEVLGSSGTWVTMFHFDNGTWNWGWSNYGNTQDQLYQHWQSGNLLSGNFDTTGNSGSSAVNKDEILGVIPNGWLTLFRHNASGGWDWVWSTGPNVSSHTLYGYQSNLRNGGDTNGDGQDELLGLNVWATNWSFGSGNFNWYWSTYGSNNIAGVSYPFGANDVLLTGNIDYTDSRDEWLYLQNGPSEGAAVSLDWSGGQFNWNWSSLATWGSPPFIGDWPLANLGGSNATYQLVRAVAGQPKHLLARRVFCGTTQMRMYRVSSTTANY